MLYWRIYASFGFNELNSVLVATWYQPRSWMLLCRLFKVWGRFKIAYDLLNLRDLKISMFYKKKISFNVWLRYIFRGEFQRCPLKFHTKYLTHTLKDVFFYSQVKITEPLDLRAHKCFWNAPPPPEIPLLGHSYLKKPWKIHMFTTRLGSVRDSTQQTGYSTL